MVQMISYHLEGTGTNMGEIHQREIYLKIKETYLLPKPLPVRTPDENKDKSK